MAAKKKEIIETVETEKSDSSELILDDTDCKDEDKGGDKQKQEKLSENIVDKDDNRMVHAGKNEFNLNIGDEISSATKQIASYGVNIFSESIEFTKQILQKERQYEYKEIDRNYEIIEESLKNIIPADRDHNDGQILLMRSDTRIQNRIIGLLINIGIELQIRDWSWFDIFITGLLKCGTIKIINYIDRDLIGKILLGLCWIIPGFIKHFFDTNIDQFVSKIVIQIHSTVCLLMIMYGIYDIVTSFTKYDWKKGLLFSSILVTYSSFYYLLFYSQNVFNALLCIIAIPFCWKFIKIKGGLDWNGINKYLFNKEKLKGIYIKLYKQELYMNESNYVIDRVYEIAEDVFRKKQQRRRCALSSLILIWICFVFKFYGHIKYIISDIDFINDQIEWKFMSLDVRNDTDGDNLNGIIHKNQEKEDESTCLKDDILCNWILNEMELPEYLDVFREHGFETMDLICSINENNLNVMGIYKQSHINILLKFSKSKHCVLTGIDSDHHQQNDEEQNEQNCEQSTDFLFEKITS